MGRPRKKLTEYTKSQIEKKAWEQFSLFIRKRDAQKTTGTTDYASCVTCFKTGEWKYGDAGHWITRGKKATKFEETNVHYQCKGCNKYKSGVPHVHEQRIIEMYGEEERDRLLELSKQTRNFTKSELIEIYEEYKEKQKNI